MDVTKPYEFIGFGAMDVAKPSKLIGFGAMDSSGPAQGTNNRSKISRRGQIVYKRGSTYVKNKPRLHRDLFLNYVELMFYVIWVLRLYAPPICYSLARSWAVQ
jgi:hypothetical protein